MDVSNLSSLNQSELKDLAYDNHVSDKGTRKQLIKRLSIKHEGRMRKKHKKYMSDCMGLDERNVRATSKSMGLYPDSDKTQKDMCKELAWLTTGPITYPKQTSCDRWIRNKSQNPKTGKDISSTGPTYTKLREKCLPKMRRDPLIPKLKAPFADSKERLVAYFINLFDNHIFGGQFAGKLKVAWFSGEPNTFGRTICANQNRTSVQIMLSNDLATVDDLRDALIHQLCHAATFIIDDEDNNRYDDDGFIDHGDNWFKWMNKCQLRFDSLIVPTDCVKKQSVAKSVAKSQPVVSMRKVTKTENDILDDFMKVHLQPESQQPPPPPPPSKQTDNNIAELVKLLDDSINIDNVPPFKRPPRSATVQQKKQIAQKTKELLADVSVSPLPEQQRELQELQEQLNALKKEQKYAVSDFYRLKQNLNDTKTDYENMSSFPGKYSKTMKNQVQDVKDKYEQIESEYKKISSLVLQKYKEIQEIKAKIKKSENPVNPDQPEVLDKKTFLSLIKKIKLKGKNLEFLTKRIYKKIKNQDKNFSNQTTDAVHNENNYPVTLSNPDHAPTSDDVDIPPQYREAFSNIQRMISLNIEQETAALNKQIERRKQEFIMLKNKRYLIPDEIKKYYRRLPPLYARRYDSEKTDKERQDAKNLIETHKKQITDLKLQYHHAVSALERYQNEIEVLMEEIEYIPEKVLKRYDQILDDFTKSVFDDDKQERRQSSKKKKKQTESKSRRRVSIWARSAERVANDQEQEWSADESDDAELNGDNDTLRSDTAIPENDNNGAPAAPASSTALSQSSKKRRLELHKTEFDKYFQSIAKKKRLLQQQSNEDELDDADVDNDILHSLQTLYAPRQENDTNGAPSAPAATAATALTTTRVYNPSPNQAQTPPQIVNNMPAGDSNEQLFRNQFDAAPYTDNTQASLNDLPIRKATSLSNLSRSSPLDVPKTEHVSRSDKRASSASSAARLPIRTSSPPTNTIPVGYVSESDSDSEGEGEDDDEDDDDEDDKYMDASSDAQLASDSVTIDEDDISGAVIGDLMDEIKDNVITQESSRSQSANRPSSPATVKTEQVSRSTSPVPSTSSAARRPSVTSSPSTSTIKSPSDSVRVSNSTDDLMSPTVNIENPLRLKNIYLYSDAKLEPDKYLNLFIDFCKDNKYDVRQTVFIFPGNQTHHSPKQTLFSAKSGRGLAECAGKLGWHGIATLSLPTLDRTVKPTNEVSKKLAKQAMEDIWRAIGYGFNVVVPIRTSTGDTFFTDFIKGSDVNLNIRPTRATSKEKYEPSFWGGVAGSNVNKEIADYYLKNIKELNQLYVPQDFKAAFITGKNARASSVESPWFKRSVK